MDIKLLMEYRVIDAEFDALDKLLGDHNLFDKYVLAGQVADSIIRKLKRNSEYENISSIEVKEERPNS